MGRASREKGSRVERQLTNLLKDQNYDAQRIPMSGAAAYRFRDQNLKGDVKVDLPDRQVKIEVKARKRGFEKVYELARWLELNGVDGIFHGGALVSLHSDFKESVKHDFNYVAESKIPEPLRKVLNKVVNMKGWLGECHVLAIKQDYKDFLFLTYR